MRTGTKRSPRGQAERNERGNSKDRRARRLYLVVNYRADVDLADDGETPAPQGAGQPACRCYSCGILMTVTTLTVDRIIPGAQGGSYRRDNIRPACSFCNSSTGSRLYHDVLKVK